MKKKFGITENEINEIKKNEHEIIKKRLKDDNVIKVIKEIDNKMNEIHDINRLAFEFMDLRMICTNQSFVEEVENIERLEQGINPILTQIEYIKFRKLVSEMCEYWKEIFSYQE
jgi:predicted ATP-dependent Lon-type protease